MTELHLRVLACPERFEDMAPSERGRVCERCSREVVEFAKLDAEQLEAQLRDAPEHGLCGRLTGKGGQLRLATGLAVGISFAIAGCVVQPGTRSPEAYPPSIEHVEVRESAVHVHESARPQRDGSITISGHIRDSTTGEPIENAIVVIQSKTLPEQRERMTNARGVFAFTELPPGNYTVQALAGDANVARQVELNNHDARVNFELDRYADCCTGVVIVHNTPVPLSADSSMRFVFDRDRYHQGERAHPVDTPPLSPRRSR